MKKLILIGLGALMLCSCTPKEDYPVKQTEFLLNTVCTVAVYNSENNEKAPDELIAEGFELVREYENKLSRTIEGSDVSKINNSEGTPIEVSDETIEILKASEYYSELSQGAFDITTAPLSIRWDFEGEDPHVPPADEISELVKKVDYSKVKIDGNFVTLEPPVDAIDLGAIAKGFIADKLKEFLVENGVTSATISLGGNLYAIGENDLENRPFNIGIQNPKSSDGSIIGYVEISDKSLVTSGDYQRFFMENGKRYHHILDPKTGYPVDNNVSSVTIISDKSIDGDALSTTCFVLGIDKGLELINGISGIDAVFIDKNNNLYFSDGFENELTFTEYNETLVS